MPGPCPADEARNRLPSAGLAGNLRQGGTPQTGGGHGLPQDFHWAGVPSSAPQLPAWMGNRRPSQQMAPCRQPALSGRWPGDDLFPAARSFPRRRPRSAKPTKASSPMEVPPKAGSGATFGASSDVRLLRDTGPEEAAASRSASQSARSPDGGRPSPAGAAGWRMSFLPATR
jgi:hypothetical protein